MPDVNLTISQEVVNPIVKAKIEEAIIAAMGGSEKLVSGIVNDVLTRRVNSKGGTDGYSSELKYSWLDVVVTKQIEAAVQEEMHSQIVKASAAIKDAIIEHLRTKKGANAVAAALLDGFVGTFKSTWSSKIAVEFSNKAQD